MAWLAYQACLHAHPLKTKVLTTACITGLSDVCLQVYEHNANKQASIVRRRASASADVVRPAAGLPFDLPQLNLARTLTLAAVGFVYSGPVNHFWFAALEKCVRLRHNIGSVVVKLLCDQIMFVPVAISGYMVVRGVFEQKSQLQICTQLEEKLPIAAREAWHFWPLVNLVSFSLVPVIYRVLFGNVCALFWNAKLSLISMQGEVDIEVPASSRLGERTRGYSFDEGLPTSGFDEAWALGEGSSFHDIYKTGEKEAFPTSGFDEAWSLEASRSAHTTEESDCIFRTDFDEVLPTCGFDETWAVSSHAVYKTEFDQVLPTVGFDETCALIERGSF